MRSLKEKIVVAKQLAYELDTIIHEELHEPIMLTIKEYLKIKELPSDGNISYHLDKDGNISGDSYTNCCGHGYTDYFCFPIDAVHDGRVLDIIKANKVKEKQEQEEKFKKRIENQERQVLERLKAKYENTN